MVSASQRIGLADMVRVARILLVAYIPLSFTVLPPPSSIHLVIGLTGAVLVINFLNEIERGGISRRLWNAGLAAVALTVTAYFWANIDRLTFPLGPPPAMDYVMGIGILLTVLEASRQRLGNVLPGLAIVLALYILVGSWLPDALYHPGLSAKRLIFQLTGTLQGPYGQIPSIVVTIVAIFLVFGGVIQGAGVAEFFVTLGKWISRRLVSGAGLSAVMMSSLFGAISGSPVANAGTTGPLTIPLMKRSGYSPEEAAAIEGVAATGSQIIPPVLGTSAFIMAQLLNVPYSEIVAISLFPSLLFIMALAFTVHAMGVKAGARIVGFDGSDRPSWLKGYLLLPVGVLIVTLVQGYSPQYAAFIATCATVVLYLVEYALRGGLSQGIRGLRSSSRPFIDSLDRAAESLVMVIVAGAVIGIIVDLITIPLTIQRLSTFAIQLAGDNVFSVLAVVAIAALILGTGLPTVATYILVAMLFVPTLTQLGVPALAGHMFVFYYGVVGDITPPVAMAILIGTGIAGGSFWKACRIGMKLGFPLFLLPFLFVFQPGILSPDLSLGTLLLFSSVAIGVLAFVALLSGYLFGPVGWPLRVAYAGISVLAWWPAESTLRMQAVIICFCVLLGASLLASRKHPPKSHPTSIDQAV